MALRSSEIDRVLYTDSDIDGNSGSEEEENILSYSGSDDYEPPSDLDSSDDDFILQKKKKRIRLQTAISNEHQRRNSSPVPSTSYSLCNPGVLNVFKKNNKKTTSKAKYKQAKETQVKQALQKNTGRPKVGKKARNPVQEVEPWDTPPRVCTPVLNNSVDVLTTATYTCPDDPQDIAEASSSVESSSLVIPQSDSENRTASSSACSSISTNTSAPLDANVNTPACAPDAGNVNTQHSRILQGKNGYQWSKEPTISTRTAARNIVHIGQRPKGNALQTETALQSFELFMNEFIINKIVTHTNQEILNKQQNYKTIQFSNSLTTNLEMKALLGILIFSALHKDNHLNASVMFDTAKSGLLYKAAFSEKRFRFLMDCLRFDDKATRPQRRESDKFAPIREIWDVLISSCIENYEPGPYLTVDEQLLAFRGRCPFKMYIPNKPAKYGIKIIMVCDAGSKYMLNAEPYLGKQSTPRGMPVSEYFVKKLITPYQGSNRNLTMDNWFTSIPLIDQLKNPPYNLTVIGTLRLDKPELPPCLLSKKNRALGDARFVFNGSTTVVSVKVKANKVVCLASTMHEGKEINHTSGKPAIIQNYNDTKVGVDCFDQMCSIMSCSRKTKRWPHCFFFGMINISCINSYIIHNRRMSMMGKEPPSRKCFMEELYKSLITPWLEERLKQLSLQRPIKNMILSVLGRDEQPLPAPAPAERKRTSCRLCPSQKRRMTQNYCMKCSKPFCLQHRAELCTECV